MQVLTKSNVNLKEFIYFLILFLFLMSQVTSSPIDDFNKLDKKLTFIFSNTTGKEGTQVYELINRLNGALTRITDMIEDNDDSIKAPVKWLLNQEGPRYLKVYYDDERLRADFGWDLERMVHLSSARIQTNDLWRQLKKTYKKHFIWFMCDKIGAVTEHSQSS